MTPPRPQGPDRYTVGALLLWSLLILLIGVLR